MKERAGRGDHHRHPDPPTTTPKGGSREPPPQPYHEQATVSADADRVQRTLDALVDEAYRKALNAGVAITSPDRWREWKRSVYVQTAKREGPGYLRRHHQRLGLGIAYSDGVKCAKCGDRVIGAPVQRDGDTSPYCSFPCAGLRAVTLTEWLEKHATPEQREGMERMLGRHNRKEATA